jgi:hypothetical protein
MIKRLAAAAAGAVVACAVAAGSAHGYSYDYQLGTPSDGGFATRAQAHNYHYIRAAVGSSAHTICVKLTRSSNGTNYGDVYCNYNQTGHHYYGDTGTLSWGKNNFGQYVTLSYHEEW